MPPFLTLFIGLLIIAAAVVAVQRKIDVRLALLVAALALGVVAGKPWSIVHKFFATLTSQNYVVPIGCAMGFAYVLRLTGCDQHLVHLLADPLKKARTFLIPGAVLVGFLVNIPIVSQTSCAVAIGSVLIPLLLAARISPVTAGAALLLGASVGGELFNPAAPEFRTVKSVYTSLGLGQLQDAVLIRTILPLNLIQLAVSTAVFWYFSARYEAAYVKDREHLEQITERAEVLHQVEEATPRFRVNPFKAAIPLVPLLLLFLFAPPIELLKIPPEWLVTTAEKESKEFIQYLDSRRIGAAMLAGVFLAALSDRHHALSVAKSFFEGVGYAMTAVISIIVAAVCFGEGVGLIGLDKVIEGVIHAVPGLLVPAAALLPLAFAAVSGSGFAATQSLFALFARPGVAVGVSPVHLGGVVSLGAAAGRTMSPVAAVTLMCASLTETDPAELVRRVAPPLLAGAAAMILAASLLHVGGGMKLNAPPPTPAAVNAPADVPANPPANAPAR